MSLLHTIFHQNIFSDGKTSAMHLPLRAYKNVMTMIEDQIINWWTWFKILMKK